MSTEIGSTVKNPYVGPQSFDRTMKDYFFGRDEEANRLFYMVQAHQLVLFYAQTGAGKSSLIQAKLIPDLEEIGWFVFPVGRVVGSRAEFEEEAEISSQEDNINPFTTNLIRYLLPKNLEASKRDSLSRIIYQRSLSQFFGNITCRQKDYELAPAFMAGENVIHDLDHVGAVTNKVLFIDQFEELMTTNLTHWNKRADFFKQINELLKQDPGMHIVLVAREEYMPGLIPYAGDIEGGIRHRFYMQRLDENGAEQAIREPAKKFNREYTAEAVKNLIDDLRTIQVVKKSALKTTEVSDVPLEPPASARKELGQFVDPMMLQIFCYQLWDAVGKEPGDITDEYRRKTGGVENALRNFYAQKVREIATSTGVGEFVLRNWIEKNLISGDNRVFVYEGITKPTGITDTIWEELEDARLIHSIPHEDRKTYELTHDRLVYVIKENNKAWIDQHLTPYQKAALKWHDLGERNDALLLRRGELKEFKTWMKQNPNKLLGEEIEENFSIRSQKAVKAANTRYFFGIAALILLVCLVILVGNNWKANQEKMLSATQLSIQVMEGQTKQILYDTQIGIGLQKDTQISFSKGAVKTQSAISVQKDELLTANAQSAQTSIANWNVSRTQEAIAKVNAREALSRQLASQGKSYLENSVDLGLLLSLAGYQVDPSTWEARSALLAGLTFGLEQKVEPYELTIPSQVGHSRTIDISPDGKTLAWGGPQGQIVLWDVATKTSRMISDPLRKWVYSLAFSPTDPNLLISGSKDSELMFWNLRDGTFNRVSLPSNFYNNESHNLGNVRMLSFSWDGRYVAVHGENSFIQIWDVYSRQEVNDFQASAMYYWDIDWSPKSNYLAAAGEDKLLYIFDPVSGEVIDFQKNPGGDVPIFNVEWSPDGSVLAFGGNTADSPARVYFYDIRSRRVLGDFLEYQGLYIYGLAYDKPEGKYLVAAGSNQPINIWNVKDKELIANFSSYNAYQFGITFANQKLALVSDNAINVYLVKDQVSFSEQLTAPRGVPLNLGMEGDMSLWTISKFEGVLTLQNRQKNITYRLGTDILGNVMLADAYFNVNGPGLISYNDGNILQQWEGDLSRPVTIELPRDLQKLTNLAISSDGNRLAVSYCDEPNPNQPQTQCNVRVLNRSRENKFVTDQQNYTYQADIQKIDFGPDGETLIVGASDGNTYLIDILSQRQNFIPLEGIAFALSPGNRTLAIGTADGKLILWDLVAAQEIGALPISSGASMTSLVFAPDGTTLYAAFTDGIYIAIDVNYDHWFNRLCNIVGRDITEEEWSQFIPDVPYQPICSPVLSATPIPNP